MIVGLLAIWHRPIDSCYLMAVFGMYCAGIKNEIDGLVTVVTRREMFLC